MNYMHFDMKVKKKNTEDNSRKMAVTARGLQFMIIGLVILVIGFILLSGGGSKDPQVFNEAMFDFRRLVIAPVVIIAGLAWEVLAIMGQFDRKKKED